MSCEKVRPMLEEYFDGELPDEKAGSVRLHIDACGECATELSSLERLEDVLLRAAPNSSAPVERYVDQVTRRVKQRQSPLPYYIAAAAAVMLFGLMFLLQGERPSPDQGIHELLSRYAGAKGKAKARILKQIHSKGEAVIPDIVNALEHSSPKVQIAAAQLLATFKNDKVRDLLLAFSRKQELSREEWVLDEIGSEDTDNELVDPAFDLVRNEGEVSRAVEVLRRLDRGGFNREARIRIVDKLAELLKNSDTKVQKLALELVNELGIEFPIPALTEFLDHPELRDSALEILKRVTGQDFGYDKNAWDRYWAKKKGM